MFLVLTSNKKYYIRYKNSDGKYTQISTKTNNKKSATIKLLEFIKKYDGNTPIISKKVSLLDFKKRVEILFNESNRSFKRELYFYDNLIQYFGESRRIDSITPLEIEEYKNNRCKCINGNNKNKTISMASVNKELRTFKAEFNRGVRLGMINKNPFLGVSYLKVTKLDKMYFTESEIQDIINNIDNPYLRNIVIFGALTGCRLNEIVTLKWENIDLQNRVIYIKNSVDENNNVIFRTKTNENREIPINDTLMSLFTGMKSIGGYVFSKENGLKYEKDHVSKQFKRVLRKLGYPESLHFHSLRHSFITNLIKKGVNINYVKELAGHKDIKTTLNYTHINTDDLMSSVNLLNIQIN